MLAVLLAQLSVGAAVHIFLVVLACVVIFGILYGITVFIERKAPSVGAYMWVVQIVLVVLAGLVAIGIILDTLGYPVIERGR